MTKLFLFLLISFFSFIMFFLNHPLSMGLMLLIQTIMMCLMSGIFLKTYWFSYILFLTFLGGLLVLFIYVSSVASNELFQFSTPLFFFFMLSFTFSIMFSFLISKNLNWLNSFINSDMDNFFNLFLFFNNENKINLSNLYNNQLFLLMAMLIIYLFITLVSVVKITNIFYGPLRSYK